MSSQSTGLQRQTPLGEGRAEDLTQLTSLVNNWGFFRDSGQWEELRDTFHSDGTISVAWFSGPFSEFVAASRARAGKSFSKHVMCGSHFTLGRNRALAETNVLLFGRSSVGGTPTSGQTIMRFLDCVERRKDSVWRIASRVTVYDHDLVAPAGPWQPLAVTEQSVSRWPPAYRFLAWRLDSAGLIVLPDLPVGGDEKEASRRRQSAEWLSQE